MIVEWEVSQNEEAYKPGIGYQTGIGKVAHVREGNRWSKIP